MSTPGVPLEDRLFRRFRRTRDPAALGAVYDLVAADLLRVALHVAGDPAAAEDLLQSTFVTALEAPERWDGVRPLRPWLLGVLRHHAHSARRSAARSPDAERLAHAPPVAPGADAEREELRRELGAALERLPEDWRPVLVLRIENGLSAAEIAHALGRPPGTVRSQLARGIERLRAALPASLAGALALTVGRPALGQAALRDVLVERATALRPASPRIPWRPAMTTSQIVTAALVASSLGIVALVRGTHGLAPGEGEALVSVARPADAGVRPGTAAPPARRRPAVGLDLDPDRALGVAHAAEPDASAATSAVSLVRVHVTHEDGRPARGVCVLAGNTDDGLPYAAETVVHTDADGRAEVEGLAAGWIRARLLCGSAVHGRLGSARPLAVELVIPTGIRVEGEVVDADGVPVPGAAIWVSERWMRESGQVATQAGANGRFSLEGLTADNLVGARSAAHAPSPLHLVRAAAGKVAELRIELLEPGHALAGSVVDERGEPIAGAEVEAGGGGSPWIDRNGLSAPPPPPQRTRSGPDGRFAFEAVPAGAVRVCARAPGRCATTTSVALDRRGLDDARIELAPEAIVVGTLRDHRGTPVHAASIRSGPYNGFTVSATTSEFDGSFRLRGLPAGAVELLAEHLDIGRTRATVTLLRGEERRWDPVLPAVPTISGSLTDEDGSPLEGWTVAERMKRPLPAYS
jgi:RNA polymerase sigma-70 factor (ECF subfamily)